MKGGGGGTYQELGQVLVRHLGQPLGVVLGDDELRAREVSDDERVEGGTSRGMWYVLDIHIRRGPWTGAGCP